MSTAATPHHSRVDPATAWLRQPGESAQQYQTFVAYRDQIPPRSLRRCAAELGRGARQIQEWSRTWRWVERADAWTAHLAELEVRLIEEEVVRRRREENEELYRIGKNLQLTGHARLVGSASGAGELRVAALDPNTFTPGEVVRLLDVGTKLVRLSLGLPLDLAKGKLQVPFDEVQRMFGLFLEIAEQHMSREAHEAFVRDCDTMLRRRFGV